jgi:hypothetical protein
MIKSKKLAFSAVTVRQLTANMSEDQLRAVAGGTVVVQGGGQVQATRQCVAGPNNGATMVCGSGPCGIPTNGGGGGGGITASRACPTSQGNGDMC